MQLVDRLLHGRLSNAGVGQDATLTTKLIEVEKLLLSRLAAVTEFANRPGATAVSIVESLLSERASVQGAGDNRIRDEEADNGDADPRGGGVESDSILRAINLDPFRHMAASVLAADVEDVRGRRRALVRGFANDCVLSVRVLCQGSVSIVRKHAALGRLHSLRRHLPEYLTFHLVADAAGNIPSRLRNYSILGPFDDATGLVRPEGQAFFDKLLKFDLQAMDWMFAPGGLLALKAARDGGLVAAAKVHPLDIYTIPGIVKELGAMVHQLLVCMGGAKADTETAVTFQSWTDLYLAHLAATSQLVDDASKIAHLDDCHRLFALGLRVAGERMAEAVFNVNPDRQDRIPPPVPLNEDPAAYVTAWGRRREAVLDAMIDHLGLFPTPPAASTDRARFNNPWVLPLRSECHKPTSEWRPGLKRPVQPVEDVKKLSKMADHATTRSLAASHMWLSKGKELFVSGKVWNIGKVTRKLNVGKRDCCWPVLLNARTPENRIAHCEKLGTPGHENLEAAAHRIPNFDLKALVSDATLWRHASESEKKKLNEQIEKAGLPVYPDKGIPKERGENSGDAKPNRGRGRGRGRWGFR